MLELIVGLCTFTVIVVACVCIAALYWFLWYRIAKRFNPTFSKRELENAAFILVGCSVGVILLFIIVTPFFVALGKGVLISLGAKG